ncbi:MAG: hypothetical protein ACUVWX_11800 [Kiritimatiellia bacterium]
MGMKWLVLAAAVVANTQAATILDEGSYWRYHVALRKPRVLAADGSQNGTPDPAQECLLKVHVPYRSYPGLEQLETPGPPANWTTSEFDDGTWPRARVGWTSAGSLNLVVGSPGLVFLVGQVCVRGKFFVSDSEKVTDLRLEVKYRGGVVAYINGREVARKDLPAGELAPTTAALPYPPEAWTDATGRLHPKETLQIAAMRDRTLGPIEIPPSFLRKGVNVLALAVYRSDYSPAALAAEFTKVGWAPIVLAHVNLETSGEGIKPNTARPE